MALKTTSATLSFSVNLTSTARKQVNSTASISFSSNFTSSGINNPVIFAAGLSFSSNLTGTGIRPFKRLIKTTLSASSTMVSSCVYTTSCGVTTTLGGIVLGQSQKPSFGVVAQTVTGRSQLNLTGHTTYLDRLCEKGAGLISLYDEQDNLIAKFYAADSSVTFS